MPMLYAPCLEIYVRSGSSFLFVASNHLNLTFRNQITEPPEPVLKERARTIYRVQAIIQKRYGQNYSVKAFGSTEYGVSTAKSDLDLVVIVSHLSREAAGVVTR